MKFREEKDSMGVVRVPEGAYYGAQTQRAADNFSISGLRLPSAFIHALAHLKKLAAMVNQELGLLDQQVAWAIVKAADEVMQGAFDDQFVVDVFQTGSGTSTNMNTNEVVAARANEILTGKIGGRYPVHPNDHVNLGQSSNDIIPTTIHVAARGLIHGNLQPCLNKLHAALSGKAEAFSNIPKIGRTHLQDAVPMTLGQEFSGYAKQIELAIKRIAQADISLSALALGGTAIGTGMNTHPEFAARVISFLSEETGLSYHEAENHFQAQAAPDTVIEISGALKSLAVGLNKIADDIRWLASGPRCGIGEIQIPSLQPGSSIMPGKVNPVIPEAVRQVSAQVLGNDSAITVACQSGNFELNVLLPVMAYNLLQSIEILGNISLAFSEKCIVGITADRDRCVSYIEKSLALVTGFVPHIGYDRAAALAKKAYETGKTIREIAVEENTVPDDVLNEILKI